MTRQDLIQTVQQLRPGTKVTLTFVIEEDADAADLPSQPRRSDNLPAIPGGAETETPPRLKVAEAAIHSGVSQRELKRAMKGGFLPFTEKASGRDAGAHLIATPDLDRYRDRRQAILDFREDPPTGWSGPGGDR